MIRENIQSDHMLITKVVPHDIYLFPLFPASGENDVSSDTSTRGTVNHTLRFIDTAVGIMAHHADSTPPGYLKL
jgi:hypothetical protein